MKANDLTPAGCPTDYRWGVGLVEPHLDDFADHLQGVEVVEIVAENYMDCGGKPRGVLERVLAELPAVVHGMSMSIAGPDPLDQGYISRLKELLDWVDPPWFSDNLSYSRAFGTQYFDLIPFPFTGEALDHVSDRVSAVQDALGRPFLLENSCHYPDFTYNEMSEGDFIAALVERTGCGLLLNVNNVYVNATNYGHDPVEFLDVLPLSQVRQCHMAGHADSGKFLVDTRGDRASQAVIELYERALERSGPVWTIFEWDSDIPELKVLLKENDRVREVAQRIIGEGGAPCETPRQPYVPRVLEEATGEQETGGLVAVWNEMHSLLRGKLTAPSIAKRLGVPRERIAIYQQRVRGRVKSAVEKNFSILLATLSPRTRSELAMRFYSGYPQGHYQLHQIGATYADFIGKVARENGEVGEFHADLARLEWEEVRVYQVIAPDPGKGMRVNPTLSVLALDYPVSRFVDQYRQSGKLPEIPSEASPETVLVFRDPESWEAVFHRATDELLFALKMVYDGIDVETASVETGLGEEQISLVLEGAQRVGVILD